MPIKSVPQYVPVGAIAAGDNTIVAAVAGKKIRVLALALDAGSGLNSFRFESGAGGTSLTGFIVLGTTTQFVLPLNGFGWFETEAAQLLNLELSAATLVGGVLVYEEVEG